VPTAWTAGASTTATRGCIATPTTATAGFYVDQREYNYYFREGFRRGYEDGYYTRYNYGRSYNGSDVILGTVLSGILNLQAYRW
jgi:hypothetical protein